MNKYEKSISIKTLKALCHIMDEYLNLRKDLDKFYNYDMTVTKDSRIDNKEDIVNFIKDKLLEILNWYIL